MRNKNRLTRGVVCALIGAGCLTMSAMAQNGVPVSMVVTFEHRGNGAQKTFTAADVKVKEGNGLRQVTSLVPTSSQGGASQLILLIDDSAGDNFGTQIGDLKSWITSLPSSTAIAVGYMRNGTAEMVHELTSDHAAAANSIRLPMGVGGADVSPYDSLSEVIKRWHAEPNVLREVVMISSGIEGLGGGYAPDNQYVNASIADAQKAGVIVHTIYNPSVGHWGHTYWRDTVAQSFLSQLADETGGESFITGFTAPVSFKPYLDSLNTLMQSQYVLTFAAAPEKRSGLQPVKVSAEVKSADVLAASKVYVKASL